MAFDLDLVHADAALLVLDKPAGLLAVPGRGEAGRDNLAARVQQRWPDAQVVHRLDMATSGLMLFARGAEMQRRLSAAFMRREVHKRYEAVVRGLVPDDQGEIDAPLAADWPNRPRQRVDRVHGKPSLTRWTVLARDPEEQTTRLGLEPVSGRSHQLRVHLLWIGHPIVGDALYALGPPAPRLLLHATEIGFRHPLDDRECRHRRPAPF
jgi:tRNA pseudouridine32 synthase/23S rRNA pseudouridine746 synthase